MYHTRNVVCFKYVYDMWPRMQSPRCLQSMAGIMYYDTWGVDYITSHARQSFRSTSTRGTWTAPRRCLASCTSCARVGRSARRSAWLCVRACVCVCVCEEEG